jgi:hypothetical protein
MEPACGSDWPRLTGKSSDIEGTGRDLWRSPERNRSAVVFRRGKYDSLPPMGNVPTLDRRSGQRFPCQHPDVVKRCVEPGLPSRYNTSPGERQPPPSPTRQARFPRQGERARRQAIRVWISTGAAKEPDPCIYHRSRPLLACKGMAERPSSATTAICWRRIAHSLIVNAEL